MTDPIVSIEHLSKSYNQVLAVDDLSLQIDAGQFMALLGPSGCGKTTTLRLMAGFETPDQGSIKLNGTQVSGPNVFVAPEKRNIGMVFQSYALFPHLSVAKNIAYGLSKADVRAKRVQEVLDLVHLSGLEERMPHELSGGQQQRIALARALAPHPDLILLDEPFSNLDAGLRASVRAEVRSILRSANATALFVTHDQEEALSMAGIIAVMMDGKLAQVAPPHILYQRPANRAVATFMGEANFLPGTVVDDVVSFEFGRLPIHGQAAGSVEVMLRPEEVQLTLNEAGPATITEREYYGHDQLITCIVDSGTLLRSRFVGLNTAYTPGKRVSISLPEQVVVFPAETAK
jgi:iron(III) transport system ATP-binding protein